MKLQPISVEVERDQINVVIYDLSIFIHQLFEAIVLLHFELLQGSIGPLDRMILVLPSGVLGFADIAFDFYFL